MTQIAITPGKTNSWPITVGAEGMAAAQFARCGFDVLVQAGRDKSWYDLVVTKGGNLLKVSVKASEDGQWSLTSGYGRRASDPAPTKFDLQAAIDRWLSSHGTRTVCCLVQFGNVGILEMPRIYLAFPHEIGERMRETADRLGNCAVHEQYTWTTEDGTIRVESLPKQWLFSHERIEDMLAQVSSASLPAAKPPAGVRHVALTA